MNHLSKKPCNIHSYLVNVLYVDFRSDVASMEQMKYVLHQVDKGHFQIVNFGDGGNAEKNSVEIVLPDI